MWTARAARAAIPRPIPPHPRPLSVIPVRPSRHSYAPIRHTPSPFRHSRTPPRHSRAPQSSFLRRQEPTLCPHPHAPSSPIHPSPLPGGRLGGGWKAASQHHQSRPAPIAHAALPPHQRSPSYPHPLRTFPRPPIVIPAPLPVIPAQAGTTHPTPLFPNSSLPPSRGEVRWGVECREPAHQSRPTPITHATPPPHPRFSVIPPSPPYIPTPPNRHSCALPRHSCAGRNPRSTHPPPPSSPIHPSPLPGGKVRWGVECRELAHQSRPTPTAQALLPPHLLT